MEHDHSHSHEHSHKHSSHSESKSASQYSSLIKALLVTLIFMVIEAVGGWYSNSLALISDAGHMATDAMSLTLSLATVWIVSRPASQHKWTFGFARVEVLAALVNGIAIWVLAGFLVYEALQRMQNPPEVQGPIVFVVAIFGLLANLLSMKFLHAHAHHTHGSLNLRAAYLHLAADLMGSIGAIIAGAVLWWTGWKPIDLVITFIFSGLMVVGSWDLIKESIVVLMEGVPRAVDAKAVSEALKKVAGVKELHDLHIWTVSSGKLALSVHLISEGNGGQNLGSAKLLKEAHDLLEQRFNIVHTTIQIEHPSEFESERCYDCAH